MKSEAECSQNRIDTPATSTAAAHPKGYKWTKVEQKGERAPAGEDSSLPRPSPMKVIFGFVY